MTLHQEINFPQWVSNEKDKLGVLYMILKTVMEVDQYYTVFNYGPPSPYKDLNPQGRTILDQPGMNPEPKLVIPGHSKEKIGK